jgi:hypothetical protein
LAILQKIFPSTSENALPVDLGENDPQTLFTCRIERPFGNWQVVAFFNTNKDKPLQKTFALNRLQAPPAKTYLAFDFWNQRFKGEIGDTMHVNLNPGSVALISLRPKTGEPQIIGTNRHVKMGAVELAAEKNYPADKTLKATSEAPESSMHSVFVYLPDGYGWQPRDTKIYEYNPLYNIRQTEPNVLRVDLHFNKTTRIEWEVKVQKY